MKRITVAIAIPTYGRDQVLLDTLKQVHALVPPADEVLVVDQSVSHTELVSLELEGLIRQRSIHYIKASPPNLPAARNRALLESTCDVVVFIDDDVMLPRNFLAAHRRSYEQSETVVAVAGRIEQRLGWPPRRRPKTWRRSLDFRYFQLDTNEYKERVAAFNGCNHSVLKSYAQALGGYDERFTGSALREESDLALRIYRAGGNIVYDPTAYLFHLAAPTGGCRSKSPYDISGASSKILFAFKHARDLRLVMFLEIWEAFRVSVATRQSLSAPYRLPVLLVLFLSSIIRGAALSFRYAPERVPTVAKVSQGQVY